MSKIWRYFPIAIATALSSHPAIAAQLGSSDGPAIPWLRIALALLFCIAVAWVAILILRYHQGRSRLHSLTNCLPPRLGAIPKRRIEIIETRRVSQHGDVCLFQCTGETYLIAIGPGQMLLLDKRPTPEEGKGEIL